MSQFTIGLAYGNRLFPLFQGHDKILHLKRRRNPCYSMTFSVRRIEILNRRNKASTPCNEHGYNDSIKVLDDITTALGCKPYHWIFASDLPNCSTEQLSRHREYLDVGSYTSNEKTLIMPCQSLYDLWYDYSLDTSTAVSYTHLTLPTNREV